MDRCLERAGLAVVILSLLFLTACGGGSDKKSGGDEKKVVSITSLLPASQTIKAGASADLTVVTENTEVTWPTVAGGTLTPNADGKSATFTSDTPNTYTITVTAKADAGITKTATVIVEPEEPTISIKSGATATVKQKKTIQFEADVLIPKGQPEQTPTWTVEGDCGTIDEQTGLFTAAATPGTCVVNASIVNVKGVTITDQADVTVTAPEDVEGMVYVEPGTFMMGCNVGDVIGDHPPFVSNICVDSSRPKHEVTLTNAFYIGKYEVTQAQWDEIMESNPSQFKGDTLPVSNVSWDNAQAFIAKLNERDAGTGKTWRLPTEAEWEWAARGGVENENGGVTYYSGSLEDAPDEVAWYGGSAYQPVGTKVPNELGIYDMSGNVSEWVNDFWSDSYAGAGSIDPTGPETNSEGLGVMRGGNYRSGMLGVAVWPREMGSQSVYANRSVGFRLALTLTEQDALALTAELTFFESASETVSGLWDSAVSGVKSLWNSITK